MNIECPAIANTPSVSRIYTHISMSKNFKGIIIAFFYFFFLMTEKSFGQQPNIHSVKRDSIQAKHKKVTPKDESSLFNGPLKVHPDNRRYFTDNSGRAIYLTGSHTWQNLVDFVAKGHTAFNYTEYLDMMQKNGHNFMRMWTWEQTRMGCIDSRYNLRLSFAFCADWAW